MSNPTNATTTPRHPASDLIVGAVDLYNHANPDLLARHVDDFELAVESAAAGLAAVVHRHHYSSTAGRTAVVRNATGFALLGAITLNDSVGLNPFAVDLALQFGAVWVSVPTLSARAFRPTLQALGSQTYGGALLFGSGDLRIIDDEGSLLPAMTDVLHLTVDARAVLGLGYVAFDEAITVARTAAGLGHRQMVVTNAAGRFGPEQIQALMDVPGVYAEITAYRMHPAGPGRLDTATELQRTADFMRQVGVDRCVLSSDGGMLDGPPAVEIFEWALGAFSDRGFTDGELRVLTHTNPRRLVPTAPPEG
jgi:Family of unknown function (DUF6282)